LASIHNLRFVLALMERIRASILEKRFDAFRRDFLDRYQPANEAARQAQKEQWLQTRGG
jgi:tRNA-guanine family transglycosylase